MRKVARALVLSLGLAATIGLMGPPFAAGQAKKDKGGAKGAGTAVFELYKDTQGKFRFRLKDGEGTLLAMSVRGYDTKSDCQKIITAIRADAAKAKIEDSETTDKKTTDKKTEDKTKTKGKKTEDKTKKK